jgi:hypothetical protein
MRLSLIRCWTLALGCALSLAQGELVTEKTIIELRPKPEDDNISTEFVFHNRGSKAVRVLDIQSACSCLSASLDKAIYQPGEKGVGKADFSLSSFSGRFEKTLHVATDDPAQREWIITFAIEVPELISITPRTVEWNVGDEPLPKTARVRINEGANIAITSMVSTREAMEFSWKEISPGKEYEVTLKPRSTAEVLLGALKMETNSSIRRYQRQMVFFSIFRKPSS